MSDFEEITDDMLVTAITTEVSQSEYSGTSTLSQERSEADYAYTNLYTPKTAPRTGMSSILHNVVQPAVDTLTTYVGNIFTSNRDTVVFVGADGDAGEKERAVSKAVNDVIYKDNDGFHVITELLKDSFLHKTGIVKITWDESPTYFKYEFEGTQEELAISMAEKEFEGWNTYVVKKEKLYDTLVVENHDTGETMEVTNELLKATVRCYKNNGVPRLMNIPPEEFLINEGATSINDSALTRFVCHRQLLYMSDVVSLADELDVDLDIRVISDASNYLEDEYEIYARHGFDGTYNRGANTSAQEALRQVVVTESWIRADRDGDGIAEWRHCFTIGKTLLSDEEWYSDIPFASYTPFSVPHKFYGQGVYDLLRDEHATATGLLRAALDCSNAQNLVRFFGDPRHINTRDLKSGKPGIIPVTTGFDPKMLMEVPKPTGSPSSNVQLLQYLNERIIAKIGIDPVSGMVSTDVEKSGNDAIKTSMTIDNASAKVETLARRFAETAMRDMVWTVYNLLVENGKLDDADLKKSDLIAKVGLGHQSGVQKVNAAQAIVGQQRALTESGVAIPPKYLLNAASNVAKSLGEEDPGMFFPPAEEIEAERKRQEEMAMAQLQQQQQMQQTDQAEGVANNEAKRRLEDAKAIEAEAKASHAERKLMAEEERTVVELDNIKSDNELNKRRQEGQEEQMAENIRLREQTDSLQRELAELKAKAAIEVALIKAGDPKGDANLNDIRVK